MWWQLEALYVAQGGRCAYTGKSIRIGENASLEHVSPASRDKIRASDIDNLKWVDITVNRSKADMQIVEYLSLCREVLEHFGYNISHDLENN